MKPYSTYSRSVYFWSIQEFPGSQIFCSQMFSEDKEGNFALKWSNSLVMKFTWSHFLTVCIRGWEMLVFGKILRTQPNKWPLSKLILCTLCTLCLKIRRVFKTLSNIDKGVFCSFLLKAEGLFQYVWPFSRHQALQGYAFGVRMNTKKIDFKGSKFRETVSIVWKKEIYVWGIRKFFKTIRCLMMQTRWCYVVSVTQW